MDCVGCEKCRLWGKLQVLGLGTALKILFSVNGQDNTGEMVTFWPYYFNYLLHLFHSTESVFSFRSYASSKLVILMNSVKK